MRSTVVIRWLSILFGVIPAIPHLVMSIFGAFITVNAMVSGFEFAQLRLMLIFSMGIAGYVGLVSASIDMGLTIKIRAILLLLGLIVYAGYLFESGEGFDLKMTFFLSPLIVGIYHFSNAIFALKKDFRTT